MQNPMNIDSINFNENVYPCCNHCRYCSAGKKHLDNIPFYRYVRVMERFLDWKEKTNKVKTISSHIMYTHALMTYEQSKKFRELSLRGGYHPLELQMDGCIFMPEDDLERILDGHRRAGYDRYSVTMNGCREIHDLWAGRKGEFDFIMMMAKIGVRLGYERQENILISQSSIPQLQELTNCFDAIGGKKIRSLNPVGYFGWAKMLEKERITRADVPRIPPHLLAYSTLTKDDKEVNHVYGLLKSEREWIEWIPNHVIEVPVNSGIGIHLDSSNIDYLETAPCDDIFNDYVDQYVKKYQPVPDIRVISEKYGDRLNEKIYHLYEIDNKWTDLYNSYQQGT